MRRYLATATLILGCAPLAGCEDGPNQPYSAAPANAAGNWNSAGPDAATSDPGMQGYDAGGGGTNAINVCTPAEQSAAWAKAFMAPIVPPFQMGGVDLSNGGTFKAVELQDVITGSNGQTQLCQGGPAGACSASGEGIGYQWGPSGQLYSCYDPASQALTFLTAFPGYTGQVKFTLPKTFNGQAVPKAVDQDGNANDLNFVWEIGKPITENGKVLNLGWTSQGMDHVPLNKLYLGMLATFAPSLIAVTNPTVTPPLNEMDDGSYDCFVPQKCRTSANPDASGGNFGCRPAALYFDAAESQSTDPATAATPGDIYMYPAKYEPYSFSAYDVSLDTFKDGNADPNLLFNGQPIYGPYAPAGVLSPAGAPVTPFCTVYMGQSFGQFEKNCVNVTGDSAVDKTSLEKLLGAQVHTTEWFVFSINGINENFGADQAELTQNGVPSVLQDTEQTPNSDDVATDFFVDIRAYGLCLNDMRGNSSPPPAAVSTLDKYSDSFFLGQDLHGTAAIEGYYRQLVYNDLKKQLVATGVTPQTNPESCWFDSSPYKDDAVGLANALATWVAPVGCTGFEQMVTAAMPTGGVTCSGSDPNCDDGLFEPTNPTVWTDYLDITFANYGILTLFRPGDPQVDFVADPIKQVGFNNNDQGSENLLQASLNQVVGILGRGNVNNVPPAARDWRYYLTFWGQAFIKYLLNRHMNPTWQDLYNDDLAAVKTMKQVNQDQLFFDLFNGLDRFEYVDRTAASTLGAPLDMDYEILLSTSNTQANNYYQRLEREEKALYTSMLADKSQVPGSNENVNVSDLFGAPAILRGVPAAGATDAMGNPIPGKDAWYCVTTLSDADCPGGPPTDASGNVLVDGEGRPLFTNYHGIWTGTAFSIGQQLPITETKPYIQSAMVDVPNYKNPYDLTSPNTPLSTLVPWFPSQPTNGFEIPINGQRTQFVQTGSLDFSGVTLTTNVDYIPQYDPTTGADTGGAIAAVETQDFLGYVFPCVDGPTGDILLVRMYTSVLDIVTWLEKHPTAQASCNISIRYSPYDNYPDIITSLANGVMVNVNPGAGGGAGRVADATLFDVSLLTQAQ